MKKAKKTPGRPAGKRGAGTAERYEARRREVMDAAATLFAERGFEGTSFRDIADAVGLLKGSLYYYAPSKEQLLFSIIHEVHESGRQLVEDSSSDEMDTVEQLRQLIGNAVEFVINNREKNIIAMRDFRSLSDESQRELAQERVIVWDRLRALIRLGKREGVVRDDADDLVVATAIVGAINYLPSWYEHGRPPSASRMISGYRDFLVEGLLA